MIPYGRQSISDDDIRAVVDVLRSDFLTQGPEVPLFEDALCTMTGGAYGVAVNSGTSALHLACRAVDLGAGDVLWTTPITFAASANCALHCGAGVDFVDIDPRTFNLSVKELTRKLEQAEKSGKLPKVLIPVHLCGLPCDMEAIGQLAVKYGFYVIEDACHAFGGSYRGEPVGNCRHSDITVFSFHPVKSITTGEGGMAVTNDKELAEKMALLRSHGITRDPKKMSPAQDAPWYYQQIALGYNYRMSDLQAALGRSQLNRLEDFIRRRHEIASRYDDLLAGQPVKPQHRPNGHHSSMHLYVIRLQADTLEKTHQQVIAELHKEGIGAGLHYIPVHIHPWYQAMGFSWGNFPEAECYYREAISLPVFPNLEDGQVDEVVRILRKVLV